MFSIHLFTLSVFPKETDKCGKSGDRPTDAPILHFNTYTLRLPSVLSLFLFINTFNIFLHLFATVELQCHPYFFINHFHTWMSTQELLHVYCICLYVWSAFLKKKASVQSSYNSGTYSPAAKFLFFLFSLVFVFLHFVILRADCPYTFVSVCTFVHVQK